MKVSTDMRYESRLDFEAFAKMRDWDTTRSQINPERYANDRTQGAWAAWCHQAPHAVDERTAADAARYRWLRDRNDWYREPRLDEADGAKWELVFYSPQRIEDPTDDDGLDAAVDAAIAEDLREQLTEREPNPTAYNDGHGGLRWR